MIIKHVDGSVTDTTALTPGRKYSPFDEATSLFDTVDEAMAEWLKWATSSPDPIHVPETVCILTFERQALKVFPILPALLEELVERHEPDGVEVRDVINAEVFVQLQEAEKAFLDKIRDSYTPGLMKFVGYEEVHVEDWEISQTHTAVAAAIGVPKNIGEAAAVVSYPSCIECKHLRTPATDAPCRTCVNLSALETL